MLTVGMTGLITKRSVSLIATSMAMVAVLMFTQTSSSPASLLALTSEWTEWTDGEAAVKMPMLHFSIDAFGKADTDVDRLIQIGWRGFSLMNHDGLPAMKKVGTAIKKAIASGAYSREDFFVSITQFCGTPAAKFIQATGLEYVDLSVLHSACPEHDLPAGMAGAPKTPYGNPPSAEFAAYPDATQAGSLAEWRKYEALHEAGKAKAIGVSRFTDEDLAALIKAAEVKPAVNAREFNLATHDFASIQHNVDLGVVFYGYSPFGSYHQATDKIIGKKEVKKVAAAHPGFTKYQVALRWAIQHGVPMLVFSSDLSVGGHAQQLLDVMKKLTLTATEMDLLDKAK